MSAGEHLPCDHSGIDSAKPSSASMPQAFSFAFAVNGNASEHAELQAQENEDKDRTELPADIHSGQAASATEPQQSAASLKQVSSHKSRLEMSPWQRSMLIWQRPVLCLQK